MHNPFGIFNNSFINVRGEIQHNLDKSRSKKAVEIREAKKRAENIAKFKYESENYRILIVEVRRNMEQLRKEGMMMPVGEERATMFKMAAEQAHEAQGLQKKISEIAVKYGVR